MPIRWLLSSVSIHLSSRVSAYSSPSSCTHPSRSSVIRASGFKRSPQFYNSILCPHQSCPSEYPSSYPSITWRAGWKGWCNLGFDRWSRRWIRRRRRYRSRTSCIEKDKGERLAKAIGKDNKYRERKEWRPQKIGKNTKRETKREKRRTLSNYHPSIPPKSPPY